jgi:hypothetical protein
MSDEQARLNLLEYRLAARGASPACPMCRHERWGVLRASPQELTFPPVSGLAQPLAYALTCLQCGFVRLHVADIVDAAMGPEPAEEG